MTERVLDKLVSLEQAELERYVDTITVDGVIAQTASVTLNKGQQIWVSKGSLLAYAGIDWHLKIPGGAGKAVSRMMSGEGVSLTHVTASHNGAKVILAANQPGRLVTWDLSNGPIVCTSGSFVAAFGDVDIDVTVARSAAAALFGGAGLFMQKLSGTGIVIVHGAGDFIEQQLSANDSILVSTGNLAVFSDEINYSVRRTGGCFKSLVGGEGFFMTELKGPGWVMLQSLKKLPVAKKGRE